MLVDGLDGRCAVTSYIDKHSGMILLLFEVCVVIGILAALVYGLLGSAGLRLQGLSVYNIKGCVTFMITDAFDV